MYDYQFINLIGWTNFYKKIIQFSVPYHETICSWYNQLNITLNVWKHLLLCLENYCIRNGGHFSL